MSSKPHSGHLVDDEEIRVEEQTLSVPTSDPEAVSVHESSGDDIRPLNRWSARLSVIRRPISRLHQRIPLLRRLPSFVIFPITILIFVNCGIWAIVGIILRYHPCHTLIDATDDSTLVGPVTLAYTFGLRHALDADHIAAIDNVFPIYEKH